MLPRERVLMALDHQEPDRIPIDLGSTPVSGICRNSYADLLAKIGLAGREIEIVDVLQQLAGVHEDVLEALEVDFRGIVIADHVPAMVGGPRTGWAYSIGYIKALIRAVEQV